MVHGSTSSAQVAGSCIPGHLVINVHGEPRLTNLAQSRSDEAMLWETFWEISSPGIHVDVTFTSSTYLKTAADRADPFMATLFPNASGLF